MLIIMKQQTEQINIDKVIEFIKKRGFEAHVSNGELHTVIGAVGNKIIDKRDIELLDGVEEVIRISTTEEGLKRNKRERWYDIDATLRTAISLLQNCPTSTRSIIAKEMAQMVIERFENNGEEDIDDEDMDVGEESLMDAPNLT